MFLKPKAALVPMWAVAGLHMMLVLAPAQAQTQTQTPAATAPVRPDPAYPQAPVPAASYFSPLRAYRRFAEPPVAPWRETNVLVGQRGGWRAYAREGRDSSSAQPEAPGASQPAASPSPKPAAGGHSGHEMK